MMWFPHKSLASPSFASCYFRVEISIPLHFHPFLLAANPNSLSVRFLCLFHIPSIQSSHAFRPPSPQRNGRASWTCPATFPRPCHFMHVYHFTCLSLSMYLVAYAWLPCFFKFTSFCLFWLICSQVESHFPCCLSSIVQLSFPPRTAAVYLNCILVFCSWFHFSFVTSCVPTPAPPYTELLCGSGRVAVLVDTAASC